MRAKNLVEMENPGESSEVEKEVVILLSDMIGYSLKTAEMRPAEIKKFMMSYHTTLKGIVRSVCGERQRIESSAGDGAVAVFEKSPGIGIDEVCGKALQVALEMVYAMERGIIPPTRIGLYSGQITEAVLEGKIMRFGTSFSVASRLEELCGYFGTRILMDREVAFRQTGHGEFLASIGKVTPKNFCHPVHLYSLYRPGTHGCPADVDEKRLRRFIEMKNRGVELFCGNSRHVVAPDFPLARILLLEAQEYFVDLTGKRDLATERILEYIGNHPRPDEEFKRVGMKIGDPNTEMGETRLLNLSSEFFKAIDAEFYQTLVVDTDWERKFKLIWRKKGECIIRYQDRPDGVYFIDNGIVSVLDGEGRRVCTLTSGDVFGEMAYFTRKGRRSATVVAKTDLVLRRVSGDDLMTMPVIRKIFKRIAHRRKKNGDRPEGL